MGGKNHLLDTGLLNALYKESTEFNRIAESNIKTIQQELGRMNDLLIRNNATWIEGSGVTRELILSMGDAVSELKDAMESTQRFVDARLGDAVLLESSKDASPVGKGIVIGGLQAELYLKK